MLMEEFQELDMEGIQKDILNWGPTSRVRDVGMQGTLERHCVLLSSVGNFTLWIHCLPTVTTCFS